MKNIVLFYEHINREYYSCLELKKKLEEKNDVTVYLYSIVFEYFKAVKLIKKLQVDMVIMPWIYHENDYDYLQPFIKNNPNLYVVNLHHEQIGSDVTYKILLPRGIGAKNSTIHFVWGENFKKKLVEHGIQTNLIFTTGNIRSDNIFNVEKDRETLSKEFNLSLNKKWILLSENRGWVLTFNKSKYKNLIYRGFSLNELEERLNVNKESLNITIQEFEELGEEFFSIYEIIYRPHPGTQAPKLNNRIKIIDKYNIYEWINAVDINIVWNSTTIFESDIFNVPSFVYEPIENPKKFKTDGIEEYPKIKRISELMDWNYILEWKNYQHKEKKFEKYIGKVDGLRATNMADTIYEILENGVANYRPFKRKYNKFRYFKKFNLEILTKVVVKLGILESVKFPKTAYSSIKDIPYKK